MSNNRYRICLFITVVKFNKWSPICSCSDPFGFVTDASNAIFKVDLAPETFLKESDSHPNPFDFLTDASNAIAKVEEVPKEFLKLVGAIEDAKTLIDEARSKDEDIATAIIQASEAVDTAFVHARCYITKCYEVADYICDEEQHVIKAIEEGNVEEFKNFLENVLGKSKKCHKDITILLDFIEKEKEKIIEEEKKAKTKKDDAAASDRKKRITKSVAGGGLLAAGGGVIAAGALLIGPQAIVTVPALLGVGLFGAAAGTIYNAMWGSSLYQFYGKAIKAFEELREALAKIENALKKVNEQLKLGIDNNLSDMKEKSDKLEKDFIKRSIIKKMGTIKVQSEHLKEYCGPLKDAKDLEDFKKIYKMAK